MMKTIRVQQLDKGHYVEEAYNKYGDLLLKHFPIRTGDDIERLRDLGVYRLIVTGEPEGRREYLQSPSLDMFRRAVERPDNESEQCIELYKHLIKKVRQVMLCVETDEDYDLNSLHPYVEKLIEFSSKQKPMLGLLSQIETNTYYAFEHAINAAIYAAFYGQHQRFKHERLINLVFGTLLLDIGEMELPNDIILNSRDLSDDEFESVKRHPLIGADLIEDAGLNSDIKTIVEQHHERPDGSGYPNGLTDLSRDAMLASIADVFDAITSNRLYRQGVPPDEGFDELWEEFGDYPEMEPLLSDFVKSLGRYPPGSIVRLSNDVIGLVLSTNPENIKRPHVKVLIDPDGNELLHPYVVDLHTTSLHRQEIDHTVYDKSVGVERALPLHDMVIEDLRDLTEALNFE